MGGLHDHIHSKDYAYGQLCRDCMSAHALMDFLFSLCLGIISDHGALGIGYDRIGLDWIYIFALHTRLWHLMDWIGRDSIGLYLWLWK